MTYTDWIVYVFIKGIGAAEDMGHKLLQIQSGQTSYTNPDAYKEVVLAQLRTKEYVRLILAEYAFILPASELEYNDLMADSVSYQSFDELDDDLLEYQKTFCPNCKKDLREVGIAVAYSAEVEFCPDEDSNRLDYKCPDSVTEIDSITCSDCGHELDVSATSDIFQLR